MPTTKAEPRFTTASLQGAYGYLSQAFADNFRPAAAIGLITFDGKGGLVGFFKASDQGTLTGKVTYTGKYTVDADGTGNLNVNFDRGGSDTNEFVIVNGGLEIFVYNSLQGRIATFMFKKQ